MPAEKSILFYISSPSWGGLEMNFVRLAYWLQESGKSISFLACADSPSFLEAKKNGLETREINKPSKYLAISKGRRLSNEILRAGSGIVFFSFGMDNDVIAWAKAFSSFAFKVIYVQQMQLGVSKRNLYQNWRFSSIDRWVSPLKWLKNEVLELTNIPEKKIMEIPLGQDLEKFAAFSESKEKSREILELGEKSLLIGTIGRLDPAKGMDFLIECFSKLSKEFQNVDLLIMGENTRSEKIDYAQVLRKQAEKLGVSERVRFLPFSKEPERFYNALDIFLMASRKETFGMVTVEAMASQKPIIAPDSGGSPELLGNGDVGVLYRERDSNEFILKLSTMLRDEADRTSLAVKARERALSHYSRIVVCNKMLRLIEEI